MVASRVETFYWASTAVSQRVSIDTWLNWFRRLSRPLLSTGPMMDRATLEAYDANAASFAEDWEAEKPPLDVYEKVRRYFKRGLTADIGCGSGRDTAWLKDKGYLKTGFCTTFGDT